MVASSKYNFILGMFHIERSCIFIISVGVYVYNWITGGRTSGVQTFGDVWAFVFTEVLKWRKY